LALALRLYRWAVGVMPEQREQLWKERLQEEGVHGLSPHLRQKQTPSTIIG
jgi:hypothetical protein